MVESREDIVRQIEAHRSAIASLEGSLGARPEPTWSPVGFYLTYYVVAGTIAVAVGVAAAGMLTPVVAALAMLASSLLGVGNARRLAR